MLRNVLLALSRQPGLRRAAESGRWGRRVSRRFVAGVRLEDAVAAAGEVNRQGLAASLDPLGENVDSVAAAERAGASGVAILDAITAAGLDANLSVKLTHLGLDLGGELAAVQLRRLARHAATLGSFVRVDMEGSAYTEATLALVERLHAEGLPVGTVLQASLHRTPADLERLLGQAIPIRLVKGAYREPRAVAWQHKPAVDASYRRLIRRLLDQGGEAAPAPAPPPAIATHDPRLIRATLAHARQHRIGPARFEFQMLYGVRRDLQRRLRSEGWRVRVYIPFGREWYPYLMRRLAERPANLIFLLRNLGH